MSVKLLYWFI